MKAQASGSCWQQLHFCPAWPLQLPHAARSEAAVANGWSADQRSERLATAALNNVVGDDICLA